MRATIQELVHAPQTDYVETFQALAQVNLEIQNRGPTAARLLRRGVLELDMGAFLDARDSIQDALIADGTIADGMYYLGLANVLLSLQKAGVIASAPGQMAPEPARVHMEQACVAFESAMEPGDEDLQAQLAACQALLDDADDEDAFVAQFEPI